VGGGGGGRTCISEAVLPVRRRNTFCITSNSRTPASYTCAGTYDQERHTKQMQRRTRQRVHGSWCRA
jgi:hypothetical protein